MCCPTNPIMVSAEESLTWTRCLAKTYRGQNRLYSSRHDEHHNANDGHTQTWSPYNDDPNAPPRSSKGPSLPDRAQAAGAQVFRHGAEVPAIDGATRHRCCGLPERSGQALSLTASLWHGRSLNEALTVSSTRFNHTNNAPNARHAYYLPRRDPRRARCPVRDTKSSRLHLDLQGFGPVSDRSGAQVDLVPRRAAGQSPVLPGRSERDEIRPRRSGGRSHQGRLIADPAPSRAIDARGGAPRRPT